MVPQLMYGYKKDTYEWEIDEVFDINSNTHKIENIYEHIHCF